MQARGAGEVLARERRGRRGSEVVHRVTAGVGRREPARRGRGRARTRLDHEQRARVAAADRVRSRGDECCSSCPPLRPSASRRTPPPWPAPRWAARAAHRRGATSLSVVTARSAVSAAPARRRAAEHAVLEHAVGPGRRRGTGVPRHLHESALVVGDVLHLRDRRLRIAEFAGVLDALRVDVVGQVRTVIGPREQRAAVAVTADRGLRLVHIAAPEIGAPPAAPTEWCRSCSAAAPSRRACCRRPSQQTIAPPLPSGNHARSHGDGRWTWTTGARRRPHNRLPPTHANHEGVPGEALLRSSSHEMTTTGVVRGQLIVHLVAGARRSALRAVGAPERASLEVSRCA